MSGNPDLNLANPLLQFDSFDQLETSVYTALEMYANVHRGSGQRSLISTLLFEQARDIILDLLGCDKNRFILIFANPLRSKALTARLKPGNFHLLTSQELGLPLGIHALAIDKKELPKGTPIQTGGGTVKIVSNDHVLWADSPDKFEAGTPAIVNAIAFAKALLIACGLGKDCFKCQENPSVSASDLLYQDELTPLSGIELLRSLRKTLIGGEVPVPTASGPHRYTNLDNGASTPTFEPIWSVVKQTWRQPISLQHEIIVETKKICAGFLGAPQEKFEILFTSNTTEALNIAARTLNLPIDAGTRPVILNTLLEHNSNELPWRFIPGAAVIHLGIDEDGFINLDELDSKLREYNQERRHGEQRIRLVTVCGASNVLGTMNDLHAISRIVHAYGVPLLVDAAQLFAHQQVAMDDWHIDCLTFSGHKAYAPFGSGGLVFKKGFLRAAAEEYQEFQASGEENVIGIAALGKAVNLLQRIGMDVVEEEERKLVKFALEEMKSIPDIEIFGEQDTTSPHFQYKGSTITFAFRKIPHNLAAQLLAEEGGIGVRDGCFCAHLLLKKILKLASWRAFLADAGAILFPRFTKTVLPGLVRVSFGLENDERDAEMLLKTLREIVHPPVSWLERLVASTYNGTPFLPHTPAEATIDAFAQEYLSKVFVEKSDL